MITKRRPLGFETLEERQLLAADPVVTLDAPDKVMIGESFQLSVAFDNADATDAGYGPFVDLLVPVNGEDGTGGVGADGITFDAATYLGVPVVTTILTFPDDGGGTGSVDHPYAVDVAGVPLTVSGDAGDQLVVMQLPFGSFTANQPAAVITVDMSLSNLADLGQDLNLRARAGFQYGNDALDNPGADPSLVSDAGLVATAWTESEPIEPTLIELSKIYLGPEDETATGPNFPRQYTIDVDIADGQTLTNLDITDLLPNNVRLLTVDAITPAGSTTTFPVTPANAPDNELVVTLPTVTGAVGAGDAQVTFSYYIPLRDADGVLVINAVSGDDATSPNNATALGDWDPLDARDPSGTGTGNVSVDVSVDVAGPEHVLTPKSIATQKSVAVFSDPGGNGLSPGDVLEYTIEIQISDYFGFENIVLSDVISDGQRFDASFTPTLQFTEHGAATSDDLDAANFTVTDKFTGGVSPVAPIDGTQEIEVRLSDELVTRGANGVVLGGLVPVGGTGGADPDAATFDAGGTTGTLVFRTIVQEDFSDTFPSGDASVDEGDELTNDVTIVGDVLAFSDATATGQSEADTSAASISVPAGTLVKSIYALNGNTVLPNPLILSPGDELTYRLQLTLPTSDIEQLGVEDYLPLPVLLAGEVTTFDDVTSAAVPAAGHAKFGPSDTFRAIFGSTPGLTTDAVSNSVVFDYGDFDIVGGSSTDIDILFTVTATDDPFADGLMLTNQARRVQDTTNAGNFVNDAIIQIVLGEPELNITKGIVASDNPNASFTSGIGPVGFTAPGTAGYRGSGTIHSDGLAATPVNSNIEEIDAGDLVTFAVVLENVGSSRVGAFDVQLKDTLPAGFVIPAGGLNITVTDGTGAAIGFADVGTGLFDAAGGILLSDPGPTAAQPDLTDAGAIDQFDATTGRNIMVLTYDLEVVLTAVPNQSITNTATLTNYASAEGGPDFTTVDPTDDANALVTPLDVSKSIIATNHANTAGLDVAIGEIVTYRSVITVPEGSAGNLTWTDFPDNGLSVIDILSLTPSTGELTLGTGTFADVLAAAVIGTNGDSISLSFPDLDNDNLTNTTAETITIEYRTVVLNRASNNRGDQLNNLATVTWSIGATATSAPNVTIVEPTLVVAKTIAPTGGEGSNQFLVTLNLSHSGASDADAFNVTLSDALPTGLSFVGSLSNSGGVAPSTLNENSDTITATFNELLLGQTSQLQFTVELDQNVAAGTTLTNTANTDWSSLPGDITTPQSTDSVSTERTGTTGDPGGVVNDHTDSANATVTVISPALSKSIIATNQAHTAGQDVAIGEIVTYRTTITVPQASLATATLVDVPTAGLAIVDVLSVTASPTVTTSTGTIAAVGTAATIAADGASVTFDFGTLNNSDTDSAVDETITIEYRAVVLNTAANDRGDTLDNTATFNWAAQNIQASAANLTIVEPTLDVDKTIAPTTGQGVDQFTITLDISHTGTSDADAFNVTLSDALPAGLVFVGSLSSTAGVAPTTIGESSGTITATFAELQIGQTSQIEFTVGLDPSVAAGSDITNIVNSDWSSLPGTVTTAQSSNALSTERTGSTGDPGGASNDHTDSANATVTVISPALSKSIIATNQAHTAGQDVAIGEIVTYRSVITVPQASLATATLVDVPTAGLAIVDVLSVTASASITASAGTIAAVEAAAVIAADGASVTFDFGTLDNSDTDSNVDETITIEYRAVALNTTANDRGDTLDNTATFNWAAQNVQASAADLTIVEPALQVVVSNATPGTADAGDIVQFTLDVSHTGASDADAFDVSLQNLIDSVVNHLQYDPASIVIAGAGGAVLNSQSEAGGDLSAVWTDFPLGATATITFDVIIENTAPPLTDLVNDATIEWTSLPGDIGTPQATTNPVSVERTGDNTDVGTTANDHNDTDSGLVATTAPLSAKTVFSSTIALSGNGEHNAALTDLLISEEVTFSIIATLPEGTSSLIITDQLPTGAAGVIEFVSFSVNSVGASLTAGTPTNVVSSTDADGLNDRVVLDFGSVVNTADGVVNAGDEIEVLVIGRIVDVPANANGDTLTNTATIDFGTGQTIATADVEIIEPVLQIDKTGNPATAPGGSTVDYTLVVTHAAGSTSDAFAAVVTDLLADPNLTLVPGTVATSSGTVTTGNGAADTTVAVDIGDFARGETTTITFTGLVNPGIAAGVAVNNTSGLGWDSLPAGAGRPGTDTDPATLTTSAPEIDLSITKTDSDDPATVDDPFSYTLTVVNDGPSTATGVTIVDTLPATVILDGVTPSQGTFSNASNVVTINIGTLLPGESASVLIDVTAPSTEQNVSNQATVTANENDTDPANNIATEPTEILATATLAGVNWVDIDSDGIIDADETVLPGTNLTLTGTDEDGNNVSLSTVSDVNGAYLFEDLQPGTYTVTQLQPTLFIDNDDYFGAIGGGAVSGPNALTVTLAAGDDATGYNFSELGLRPTGFSKRMLLRSTLLSAATPEEAALDAAFASLTAAGNGDLDGDGDVDADDRALFNLRLGDVF